MKSEDDWRPMVIEEEVIARGTWMYDDLVPYDVELVRLRLNYDANDVAGYLDKIHALDWDHPMEVDLKGHSFKWRLRGRRDGAESVTGSFGSVEEAMVDFDKFAGGKTLHWIE